MRNSIVVRVTGGLGNQLFCLAAGLEQAERLECPLILDARGYVEGEPRKFLLGQLGFECIYGEGATQKHRNLLSLAKRNSSSGLRKFTEKSFAFDGDINSVVPGTELHGYFQSPKYFPHVSKKVSDLIWSKAGKEHEVFSGPSDNRGTVTMHVRRGDYLNPSTLAFHGLASKAYFQRASSFFNSLASDTQYRIFTDSPDRLEVDEYTSGKAAEIVSASHMNDWQTIAQMACGQGFIMSNSSFSWWGAWLMSQRDSAAQVVAPRPWFTSGASAEDLLLPDWFTLDAR